MLPTDIQKEQERFLKEAQKYALLATFLVLLKREHPVLLFLLIIVHMFAFVGAINVIDRILGIS